MACAATLCALLAAPAARAETMRCGGGVVSSGDTTQEVRGRCGEPVHETVHQRQLRGRRTPSGTTKRLIDVETWTYHRGKGRFILYLTFEGGRLTRIDRGPRQE